MLPVQRSRASPCSPGVNDTTAPARAVKPLSEGENVNNNTTFNSATAVSRKGEKLSRAPAKVSVVWDRFSLLPYHLHLTSAGAGERSMKIPHSNLVSCEANEQLRQVSTTAAAQLWVKNV